MGDISDNPFIQENLVREQDQLDAEDGKLVVTGPTCGDPGCMRAHRPANSVAPGQHYTADASIRAKELADDGKFGGQFGHLSGGRSKRSKRAAEIVAEYAVEAAPKIRQAFADGLDPHTQSVGVRQASALALLRIEADERALQLKEQDQEFQHMTKGELVDTILRDLAALERAGAITEGIVDATVVDDDE